MRYEDENIWLTKKMMATLYGVDIRTINNHIQKIFSDNELEEISTIRKFRIVQTEGNRQVSRETKHYNLYVSDFDRFLELEQKSKDNENE